MRLRFSSIRNDEPGDLPAPAPRLFATMAAAEAGSVVSRLADLPEEVGGVELRADALAEAPDGEILRAIRNATSLPLLYTRRTPDGRGAGEDELERALDAGFDLVDVEYRPELQADWIEQRRDRIVLSFHDFDGVPDLDRLLRAMASFEPAEIKIAVTPTTLSQNLDLLAFLEAQQRTLPLTVIGMGKRGLYARLLAPFFGSRMIFAVPDGDEPAAPGQCSVRRLLDACGGALPSRRPRACFAVIGNPAGHSRSPEIHNAAFRNRSMAAAYSIIESETLREAVDLLEKGARYAPAGLSVTAPFKEEALLLATSIGSRAAITPRAAAAGSVNSIVRRDDRVVFDNTDIAAFETALGLLPEEARDTARVAVVGAGGTARSALVALRERGFRVTVHNRTLTRAARVAEPFGFAVGSMRDLERFDGEVLINTLPGSVDFDLPPQFPGEGKLYVDVAYGPGARTTAARAADAGISVFDGLALLRAQAGPQSELFLDAIREGAEWA